MANLLHITILGYLQQNDGDSGMVDIKPAFEKYLDSLTKRKELKAEIDFLLDQKLAGAISRFDFLNWELLTGLYPLDKKKIELRLTEKGRNYLQARQGLKPEPVTTPAIAAGPAAHQAAALYEQPDTVLPYSLPQANQAVQTVTEPVLPVQAPAPVMQPAVAQAPLQPGPEVNLPAQQPEPGVFTPAELKINKPEPQSVKSISVSPQPVTARLSRVAEQEEEPVILTARTARVLNKVTEAPASAPEHQPALRAKERTLRSVADMPPGPLSLNSTQGKTIWARQAVPASAYDTHNPFAALGVIPLNPDAGKPKKGLNTTILLRWAVAAAVFILAVLLFLIFKKRY